MEREQVLGVIDAAFAARMRGDAAALAEIWAEGAKFELAGEQSLLEGYPGTGPGAAQPTVEAIMNLIEFKAVERLAAIVEGRDAAILSRVTMAFGGLEPTQMLLYHLWKLDEAGKVSSLLEFADNTLITREMQRLGAG
jgi:ketosteroid isomerase-like protein